MRNWFACMAVGGFASVSLGQVLLHNNGRWETGVSSLGNRISEVPFPAYDTWGIVNNGFSSVRQRAADNFVVTDPNGWQLSHAIWYAYQSPNPPANPFTNVYVGIYNVNPTGTTDLAPAWGDVDPNTAQNRLVAQTNTNVYRVRSDGNTGTTRPIYALTLDLSWVPPLPPGEYWIAIGLRGSTGTSGVATPSTLPVPAGGDAICMGRNRGTGCGSPNPELTTWTCADGEIGDGCADCDTYELTFELWGAGVEPIGACCFSDGVCMQAAESVCVGQSGAFQGVGTSCDPNPCPQPAGACCFANGSCTVQTEDECVAGNGVFQGIFTVCDPNPCPQPTGACCLPDAQCLDGVTGPACAAIGGLYQGDASACDAPAAGEMNDYTSSPNVAIPDNDLTGVTDTTVVTTPARIFDVNVAFSSSDHTYIGDLQVTLRHVESNTTATLWNQLCNSNQFEGLTVTFDDDGAPVACDSPTTGAIATPGLTTFEGMNAAGTWQLTVKDLVGGDFGTFQNWTLSIVSAAPNGLCAPAGCPGDMNCDGTRNFADIDPFVLALQGEAAYAAQFPSCLWLNGDINGDNTVNFGDIDPFVALLGAGACP